MTQDKQEPSDDRAPFKIAIIGAGMVGAFAAVTLSKLPNVEINVYEKSPGAREAGAALTFTESSLVTLGRVLDIDDIQKILFRGGPGKGTSTRHWKTGEYIERIPQYGDVRYSPAKSQRVHIHDYILQHVPKGLIHYGYVATGVETNTGREDGKARVDFLDKDPVFADLIIAADGIYSKIRRQFTKDEIKYKGAVAYRNVFPKKIVEHIKNLPDEVNVWIGRGSAMFMTPLHHDQFNVAAHLPEPEEIAKNLRWNETGGKGWEKQRLIDHFKDWDPLITEILKVMPDSYAFPLEKAPWLTKLSLDDKIAFVGDAAHPTSGVYGAGAGIGFDDVWALYRSLKEVENVKSQGVYDLKKALLLFSETRTYFLQRVVEQIEIDGRIQKEYLATAEDDEEWLKRVKNTRLQAKWISKHDVDSEYEKVKSRYFLDVYNSTD